MHWLDIIILVVLGIGLAMGFYTGLLWQVARVVGLVLSIYLAILANPVVGQWLSDQWKDTNPVVNSIIAFVGVFLAVYLTLYLLTRLLHKAIKASKLETFDRLLGALLGGAKMAGLLACVLGVMAALNLEVFNTWFDEATLARPFAKGTDIAVALIPQDFRDHANDGLEKARVQIQNKIQDGVRDALVGEEKK